LTVVAGQPITVSHSFQGRSPFRYELLNGSSGVSTGSFQYTDFPAATTTYGVRRVIDGCGESTTLATGQGQVNVVSDILTTGSIGDAVCVQSPTLIPYMHSGTLPGSTSYVIQASIDQQTWRTLPTTGHNSPLSAQFPSDWIGQRVYYRAASSNGILSGTVQTVRLNSAPNLLLSGPNNQSLVSLDASSALTFNLTDTHGSGGTVLISNGKQILTTTMYGSGGQTYASSPVGTYSVVSAYNQCGFGTARGQVRPYIIPVLLRGEQNIACERSPVIVQNRILGEFNSGNTFSYLLTNWETRARRQITGVVSSTTTPTNGRVTYALSATLAEGLPAGEYTTEIITSSPAMTLTANDHLEVQQPLKLSFPSRQYVAYVGDQIAIPVSSTGGTPYSLTLSTGDVWVAGSQTEYIPLHVTRSGSFSIVRGGNSCGTTTTSGVVSVTVERPRL
jgi:hypothetical protein